MPGIHIDGLGPSTDIHCSAENIKVAAFQSKPVMTLVKSNSKYAKKKKHLPPLRLCSHLASHAESLWFYQRSEIALQITKRMFAGQLFSMAHTVWFCHYKSHGNPQRAIPDAQKKFQLLSGWQAFCVALCCNFHAIYHVIVAARLHSDLGAIENEWHSNLCFAIAVQFKSACWFARDPWNAKCEWSLKAVC